MRYFLSLLPFILILFVFVFNFSEHAVMDHPGKVTYNIHCTNCHGPEGEGIQLLIPPLRESDYAAKHFLEIPCMIKNGMTDSILVNGVWYCQSMYPIALNEVEVANVMNYLNEEMSWNQSPVNSKMVKKIWESCQP